VDPLVLTLQFLNQLYNNNSLPAIDTFCGATFVFTVRHYISKVMADLYRTYCEGICRMHHVVSERCAFRDTGRHNSMYIISIVYSIISCTSSLTARAAHSSAFSRQPYTSGSSVQSAMQPH
jgi:hypothetical protein